MKRFALLGLVVLALGVAAPLQAQVVVNLAQARVEFTSAQHDAIWPAGTVGAGADVLTGYRAVVIPSGGDPVTASAVFSSGPIPKAVVTIVGTTTPPTYSISFVNANITAGTMPACNAVPPTPCPAYAIVLLANGPGGLSARSATAASDTFTVQGLLPQTPPAAPATVKVKGS